MLTGLTFRREHLWIEALPGAHGGCPQQHAARHGVVPAGHARALHIRAHRGHHLHAHHCTHTRTCSSQSAQQMILQGYNTALVSAMELCPLAMRELHVRAYRGYHLHAHHCTHTRTCSSQSAQQNVLQGYYPSLFPGGRRAACHDILPPCHPQALHVWPCRGHHLHAYHCHATMRAQSTTEKSIFYRTKGDDNSQSSSAACMAA